MRPLRAPVTTAHSTAAHASAASGNASPWPVFRVSSVAVFRVSLDTTMLYVAFGGMRASFPSSTAADMSWVLNA